MSTESSSSLHSSPTPPPPSFTSLHHEEELVRAKVKCTYENQATPHGSFNILITLVIGEDDNKRDFPVHRGLLCYHSSVFAETSMKYPQSLAFSYPDHNPDTFAIVIYWMYTGRFTTEASEALSFQQVLSVYYCAVDIGMQVLQNETLSLIYQMVVEDQKGLVAHAKSVYENTDFESPLRRFLVDSVVDRWRFSKEESMLHDELMMDVLVHLQTMRIPPGGRIYEEEWIKNMNGEFCGMYHDHGVMDDMEDESNYSDTDDADDSTVTLSPSENTDSGSDGIDDQEARVSEREDEDMGCESNKNESLDFVYAAMIRGAAFGEPPLYRYQDLEDGQEC